MEHRTRLHVLDGVVRLPLERAPSSAGLYDRSTAAGSRDGAVQAANWRTTSVQEVHVPLSRLRPVFDRWIHSDQDAQYLGGPAQPPAPAKHLKPSDRSLLLVPPDHLANPLSPMEIERPESP